MVGNLDEAEALTGGTLSGCDTSGIQRGPAMLFELPDDLLAELEIFRRTRKRLPASAPSGTYL